MAKGFYQIENHLHDVHKTVFLPTSSGHYKFLRMPFEILNTPATFQHLINGILNEFIGEICVVYLCDILSFSRKGP